MAALINLHPFKKIYLADLDAIQNTGSHAALIDRLCNQFEDIEFWLDCGIGNLQELSQLASTACTLVIGTETLDYAEPVLQHAMKHSLNIVLSLDYKNNRHLGCAEMELNADLWPQDIIIMSLERVGANSGPDIERLRRYRKLAPDRNWYSAGGVRTREDLRLLKCEGAAGVLIASALHSHQITHTDLESIDLDH